MTFSKELVQILCPFGEWPHAQGMQVVDEEAAKKMRRAAMSATFTRGIPIYIGHPDESGKKAKTVGRIKKICFTEGGIAVVAHYDDDTFKKIESGKLKAMSPRWQMEKLPDGKYRPIRLISAGLTNTPNIPASGKVLKAAYESVALQEMAKRAKGISAKYVDSLGRLKSCAGKACEIENSLKESAVAERIATLNKNRAAAQKVERKSVRQIGMLALERSKKTGESYTKSFAALRREICEGK